MKDFKNVVGKKQIGYKSIWKPKVIEERKRKIRVKVSDSNNPVWEKLKHNMELWNVSTLQIKEDLMYMEYSRLAKERD